MCGMSGIWRIGEEVIPGSVLIERIGEGGFAQVWKATHPEHEYVALKRILISEPIEKERRALEAMRGVRHPHLTEVYDFHHSDGVLVVVMELGDLTIEERVQGLRAEGERGLPAAEAFAHLEVLAAVLDYLNFDRKLLHRDVKSGNIVLMSGVAKLCDFGLAKVMEGLRDVHSGIVSCQFAPPEFMNAEIAPTSDQFSLAVTYYFMRTGELAFPGPSVRQTIMQHLKTGPDIRHLPDEERPTLERALARNPDNRFPTCRAFFDSLRASSKSSHR